MSVIVKGFGCRPIAKFFCNAKLGRYRGKTDIEQAAFHSIWLKLPTRSGSPAAAKQDSAEMPRPAFAATSISARDEQRSTTVPCRVMTSLQRASPTFDVRSAKPMTLCPFHSSRRSGSGRRAAWKAGCAHRHNHAENEQRLKRTAFETPRFKQCCCCKTLIHWRKDHARKA